MQQHVQNKWVAHKNKEQRRTQQSQAESEWVRERDLAAIGLSHKDSAETTNSTELAHPREVWLTTSVVQFKQLTDSIDLGVTTTTYDNDD